MTDKQELIATAIRHLFRPVVRLCIRHSVKLQEAIEMLKVIFVQVANEELAKQREAVSASKISVVTGVHRKDVTRIQAAGGEYERPDNLVSKIMVQWQHDTRFTTKAGKPKQLNAEGRASEFARLVESVNGGNLSAYTLLYEMERMGIIERKGKNVRLVWRDFVSGEDLKAGLSMLVEDSEDLIAAVEENLFAPQESVNLHLKTEFDRIPTSALPSIRAWLVREGSAFHKKIRNYLGTFDLDLSPNDCALKKVSRVALGTFSLTEAIEENES